MESLNILQENILKSIQNQESVKHEAVLIVLNFLIVPPLEKS